MAAGEAFTREQRERIERAVSAAETQTGLRFWLRVGALGSDPRIDAESTLASMVGSGREGAVLVLVGPEERQLEIMTTPGAKRRISDQAAGLAALTMTSSFTVGDIVGGLINGLRQLADSASPDPEGTQGQPATSGSRLSGRAPVADRAAERDAQDTSSAAQGRPGSHDPADDQADQHDDSDSRDDTEASPSDRAEQPADGQASPSERAEQPADGQGEELAHGPRDVPGSAAAPGSVRVGR